MSVSISISVCMFVCICVCVCLFMCMFVCYVSQPILYLFRKSSKITFPCLRKNRVENTICKISGIICSKMLLKCYFSMLYDGADFTPCVGYNNSTASTYSLKTHAVLCICVQFCIGNVFMCTFQWGCLWVSISVRWLAGLLSRSYSAFRSAACSFI